MLLQCVGVAESVRPVYLRGKLEREALYLVCSDGFWHEAGEQELYERCRPERLTGERAMREACGASSVKTADGERQTTAPW